MLHPTPPAPAPLRGGRLCRQVSQVSFAVRSHYIGWFVAVTFKQIQEAVVLRQGGMGKIWQYQVSHSWLTIRLTAPSLFGNFHLRCGDCDRAEFDTCWSPAAVQVERIADRFLVHDGAHLRVECGILDGVYNVEPY